MATTTKTIIAGGGGDYTTIAAWEAATDLNSDADIWKGVISDDSNYDENVTINGGGTAVTSYVWLTVASGNRHAGVAGTGHARMYSTGTSHILTIDSSWVRVEWLDIKMDQNGSSDEGIRIGTGNYTDILISYCIIWSDQNAQTQDGIRLGNDDIDISIDNCILYGWNRGAIIYQQTGSSTTLTGVLNVDHCSIYESGRNTDDGSGAVNIESESANATQTITVYNTWGAKTLNNEAFATWANTTVATADGTVVWNGTNNGKDYTGQVDIGAADADITDNTTSWQSATSGVVATTKSSGAWIVVTNITGGSEDFTLLDTAAGNLMAANGTNRQGSEPDARQDFSTAIDGARPTTNVDIGASQISTAGQDITPTLVSQLLAGVDPAVTSNFDVSPSLESQLLAGVDPVITTGNVDLSPSLESQLLAGVDPVITTGNVDLSPSLVSQLLAGVDPALTSNVNLSPALESQLLAGVDPAITTGNVNLSPSLVSQPLAGVDPALTTGNVNIVPSLVSQLLAGVAPALSVELTPSLVSQLLAGVDPAITTGNVNLSPSLVSQLLAGVDPAVSGDDTTITPSLVSQLLAGVAPTVTSNINIVPTLVSQLLTAIDALLVTNDGSIIAGFDIARFYRHNISGDERLVLVVGLPRSTGKGYRADESWDTASGHFALPNDPRHPIAKSYAVLTVFDAWDTNKNASQATLTSAINAALTARGYTRPNGVAIT